MRKNCNRCNGEKTNLFYNNGFCLSSQNVSNLNPNSTEYLPLQNLNGNLQSKSQMILNNQINNPMQNQINNPMQNQVNIQEPLPLFSNNFSYNENENKKNNKRGRHFVGRTGDWVCFKCNNLNFSFRTNCNRCHLTKSENQRLMYQQKYVQNLLYGNNNFSQ